jgi:hypothetical protein
MIRCKSGFADKQASDAGMVTEVPKSPPIASIEIVELTFKNNSGEYLWKNRINEPV